VTEAETSISGSDPARPTGGNNLRLSPLALEVAACLSPACSATVPDLAVDCLDRPVHMDPQLRQPIAAAATRNRRIRSAIQELNAVLRRATGERDALFRGHDLKAAKGYRLLYGVSHKGLRWIKERLNENE